MLNKDALPKLSGATIRDTAGDKIGKVGQVYVDATSGEPEWVTTKTGILGNKQSFIPLQRAGFDGDDLQVGVTKDKVDSAPAIEEDSELSGSEEDQLYRYYGLTQGTSQQSDAGTEATGTAGTGGTAGTAGTGPAAGTAGTTSGTAGAGSAGAAGAGAAGAGAAGAGAAGATGSESGRHDAEAGTTRQTGDSAMTRSEEHLNVGTERVTSGRVRLHKYVVTETEQVQVPVSHEEVRVEREPISEQNRAAATSGDDIGDAEHEVTLHAERPVVNKETEPVERVRLETETVSDTESVSGDVRKEQIEVEDERHEGGQSGSSQGS